MEMIEHVARAIHAALAADELAWEQIGGPQQARYRGAAQKAVAALRSPTLEMLAEGNRRDLPGDAANVWERMIFRTLRG